MRIAPRRHAGVGEGARTGFASVVTGGRFTLALFLTPLLTIVPLQAASPAMVAVGRALLQDPEWAVKVRDGRTDELQSFDRSAMGVLY